MAVLDACLRELDASNPDLKSKIIDTFWRHTPNTLGFHLPRSNIADAYPDEMNSGFEARPRAVLSFMMI